MEIKVIEQDWENCKYCKQSYYEYDTGYREYSCGLLNSECFSGDIDGGCPLSFKYIREE